MKPDIDDLIYGDDFINTAQNKGDLWIKYKFTGTFVTS